MATDFLTQFLGSQARARLMRVFLFNPDDVFTSAQVAKRAGVMPKATVGELIALEEIGIVKRGKMIPAMQAVKRARRTLRGKRTLRDTHEAVWMLDQDCKHLRALSAFVHEVSPAQFKDIEQALRPTGRIAAIIISGAFMGDSSRPVDLVVAGDSLNEQRLERAVRGLEPKFGREIRYAAFSTPEFRYRLTVQDRLLRDTLDFPHRVLFDRAGLL